MEKLRLPAVPDPMTVTHLAVRDASSAARWCYEPIFLRWVKVCRTLRAETDLPAHVDVSPSRGLSPVFVAVRRDVKNSLC